MRACARTPIQQMIMTPLRLRLLDALILRGMAQRTQESCTDAVSLLARHFGRSPDTLSAEPVQQYLLDVLRDLQRSRSTANQYGCVCRFFFGTVLGFDLLNLLAALSTVNPH